MKETPLNKAFEDALRTFAQDPAQQFAAKQLEVFQQTAVDFQDAGIVVTLAVRPGGEGTQLGEKRDVDGEIVANGEMEMGKVKLDFVIHKERYYDDRMSVRVYRDEDEVFARTSAYDEDSKIWTEEETGDDDDGYDDEDDESAKKEKLPQDMKSVISRYLIDVRTREEFVARYNVGPNGVPGNAVEKPFPVAAPLKLKKPGAP